MLGAEQVDLRQVESAERDRLHRQGAPFVCRGCGGRAHLRRYADVGGSDRLGVYDDGSGPFVVFVHNAGEAERCRQLGYSSGDESVTHHLLKGQLARSAKAAGWQVDLEVPSDGCRADVVASRKGRTRVLEAQVSSLGVGAAVARSEVYEREFGSVTWSYTGGRRPWSQKVESLQVDGDLDQVVGGVYADQGGTVPAEPAPLADTVPRVLSGELLWVWWSHQGTLLGFFAPVGAPAGRARPVQRLARDAGERGRTVGECARPTFFRDIRCTWCGCAGPAGRPCANPVCAEPACPGCGRKPWHDRAVCPACGTSARQVGKVTAAPTLQQQEGEGEW